MKIIAAVLERPLIEKIVAHLGLDKPAVAVRIRGVDHGAGPVPCCTLIPNREGLTMKAMRRCLFTAGVLGAALWTTPAAAVAIGTTNTFEDGTTQGWVVGVLGASHPAPPVNVSSGGPTGVDDNFLRLRSIGGTGAGSRLVASSLVDFTGDYTAAGVVRIGMDLLNEGTTDLDIRLYLENPIGGPPTATAITSALVLSAGGGWTHAVFEVDADSLISLSGDLGALLGNVTALRIFHGSLASFPGDSIVAQLGVDNITALSASAVPEPATTTLLALALGLMLVSGARGATPKNGR